MFKYTDTKNFNFSYTLKEKRKTESKIITQKKIKKEKKTCSRQKSAEEKKYTVLQN